MDGVTMAKVFRCTTPFAVRVDGVRRVVAAGELVSDTDPVFKGREGLFEPVETYVDRLAEKRVMSVTTVEAATAAPGEKRNVTPPKRGPGRPRKTEAKEEGA